MSDNERPGWVNMLDGGMVGKDIPGVGLLYGVTIKIEFTGVLAVLKAKGGGGYQVAFVGAKSLESLIRKVQPILAGEEGRWRQDEYA